MNHGASLAIFHSQYRTFDVSIAKDELSHAQVFLAGYAAQPQSTMQDGGCKEKTRATASPNFFSLVVARYRARLSWLLWRSTIVPSVLLSHLSFYTCQRHTGKSLSFATCSSRMRTVLNLIAKLPITPIEPWIGRRGSSLAQELTVCSFRTHNHGRRHKLCQAYQESTAASEGMALWRTACQCDGELCVANELHRGSRHQLHVFHTRRCEHGVRRRLRRRKQMVFWAPYCDQHSELATA